MKSDKIQVIDGVVHCSECNDECYIPSGENSCRPCNCFDFRQKYKKLCKIFANSKIPPRFKQVSLETFPNLAFNKEKFRLIKKLAATGEINGKNSMFLYGQVGRGKSGLSIAILKERMNQLVPALFIEAHEIMGRIRASYNPDSEYKEDEIIEAVKTVEFLVLDDLGAEKVSDWVKSKMFEIINARYNNLLATIITSNLNLDQIHRQYGDRLTDRIREMAIPFEIKGKNLRNS